MTTRRRFLIQCSRLSAALVAAGAVPAPWWLGAEARADDAGPAALIKGPFLQITGPDSARLRFETLTERPLPVRLERDATGIELLPTVRLDEVRYHWPRRDPGGRAVHLPDARGDFAVQDALFTQLQPGARYRWLVDLGAGEQVEGAFTASPPPGTPHRIGWLADTRQPRNHKSTARLTAQRPDLVLHGGDLQYQSDPRDTWNNLFFEMQGLLRAAPAHFCVGNHEVEGMGEFESQYQRLFDGQGASRGGPGYHAFSYAGVRHILLNSEDALSSPDDPQVRWLDAELDALSRDPALRFAVVSLHRPTFTFSKRQPATNALDTLHERFTRHPVRLVLAGHNHCYERFEVDGITYLNDGGGGASLYDPDHRLARFERRHPERIPLRKHAAKTHGVTTIDVAADGTLSIARLGYDEDEVTERFTVSPG